MIRGVIALGESLAIGTRALAISANVAAREEDDEGNVVTEITRGQILFSFAIAIGFALMLFKVGPALVTSWLPVDDTAWFVVVEGLIRVAVFIAYIGLIGLLPDLKRVFQYRRRAQDDQRAGGRLGADAGQSAEVQLDPPALQNSIFALGDGDRHLRLCVRRTAHVWYWLIASRILLLPVIAGLAYELIRYAGKHQDNTVLMALRAGPLAPASHDARAHARPGRGVSIRAIEGAAVKQARRRPSRQPTTRSRSWPSHATHRP